MLPRVLVAVFLAAHGVAHVPGFIVGWRLRDLKDLPYTTTVIGGAVDVGVSGARVLGILWLVAGLGCVSVAAGWLTDAAWTARFTWSVLGASAVLCVLGWPAARYGLVANAVIAAVVLTMGSMGVTAR